MQFRYHGNEWQTEEIEVISEVSVQAVSTASIGNTVNLVAITHPSESLFYLQVLYPV